MASLTFPGPLSRAQDIRSRRGAITQSWIGDARLAHKLRVHFAIASCSRLTAPDLQARPKTPLMGETGARGPAGHQAGSRIEREIPSSASRSGGELASRDCLCLRARTRVRPLPLPSRSDLREPAAVAAKGKLARINLKRGLALACNIICRIGVVSDYRAAFWRAAWPALRRLQIEPIFGMGFVAWHLIQFTQKAFGGRQNASSYTAKQSSTEA